MDLKEVVVKDLGIDIGNYISKITTFDDIMETVKNDTLLRTESDILPKCKIKPSIELSTLNNYYKSIIINYFENCMSKNDNNLEKYLKNIQSKIKPLENKLKKVVNDQIKTIYTIVSFPVKNSAKFKFECKVPITYGLLSYVHIISYKLTYYLEELDDAVKQSLDKYHRPETNGRYGIYGQHIGQLRYNGISKLSITKNVLVCEFYCDTI